MYIYQCYQQSIHLPIIYYLNIHISKYLMCLSHKCPIRTQTDMYIYTHTAEVEIIIVFHKALKKTTTLSLSRFQSNSYLDIDMFVHVYNKSRYLCVHI